MVDDIEPVAYIFTLTVDGEGLAVTDVVDEQRDQFFRELVWTIVVGAVGHDGGHSVCVVVGAHEMVR